MQPAGKIQPVPGAFLRATRLDISSCGICKQDPSISLHRGLKSSPQVGTGRGMGILSGTEVASEQMPGTVLGLKPCPDAAKGLKTARQTIPTSIKQPLYTGLGGFLQTSVVLH